VVFIEIKDLFPGPLEVVMKVEKIMSKRLVTVEMDDTLKVVKVIFDNVNIQPKEGKAKPYQVKQIRNLILNLNIN
jgi:hypothetical protein